MTQDSVNSHEPVLLEEAVGALSVDSAGCYIDATYGRGGHSRAIIERLGDDGRLIAFDKDPQACSHAQRHFGDDARFEMRCASFKRMGDLRDELHGQVAGICFDLGVSLPQLKQASRGFSFALKGPLDMRMNPEIGESVAQWLNGATQEEICRVLRTYGEEPHAKAIAKRIAKSISDGAPVTSTEYLASLVASALTYRDARPSVTRVFLAFRLYINSELEEFEEALNTVIALLRSGGRLVVIAFHSLEDRIAKQFIREHSEAPPTLRGLPAPPTDLALRRIGKVVYPSDAEIADNPRARSARMRVAERT